MLFHPQIVVCILTSQLWDKQQPKICFLSPFPICTFPYENKNKILGQSFRMYNYMTSPKNICKLQMYGCSLHIYKITIYILLKKTSTSAVAETPPSFSVVLKKTVETPTNAKQKWITMWHHIMPPSNKRVWIILSNQGLDKPQPNSLPPKTWMCFFPHFFTIWNAMLQTALVAAAVLPSSSPSEQFFLTK